MSLRLRLRLPGGANNVQSLEPTDTFSLLIERAASASGLTPANVEVLSGFPPLLLQHSPTTLLSDCGLRSGDTCIVRASAASAASAAAPQPTAAPTTTTAPSGGGFSTGDRKLYNGEEIVTVTHVHLEDSEPYYSIRMADGREKQTVASKLTPIPSSAASRPAAPAAGSSGAQQAAAASGSEQGSPCPACTFLNPSSARSCQVCDTPLQQTAGAAAGGGGSNAAASGGAAKLEKMPDDNSCLFHAVSFLIQPPGVSQVQQLRQAIVQEVTSSGRWDPATLGKPVKEYCEFINDPRRWGGQVELAIFAAAFNCEIAVVDVQSGRLDVYGEGSGFSQRVYMLYTGMHFDAVLFGGTRIVSPGDRSAEAQAKALAGQQRASGSFSDQDTMRLKCKICGVIVTGDYEARVHAGTGHTEFAPA